MESTDFTQAESTESVPMEVDASPKNQEASENNKEKTDTEQEEEEEVYVVEDILGHKKDKNGFKYLIKWQGFSEEDNTWENEDNIFCEDLLIAYWEKQPKGRDGAKQQAAKKKRKADEATDSNIEEVLLDHQYPPEDLEDWESEVIEVETVERTSKGELNVYLIWKNGCHTVHPSKIANLKCPQKILEFYQNHLKFAD